MPRRMPAAELAPSTSPPIALWVINWSLWVGFPVGHGILVQARWISPATPTLPASSNGSRPTQRLNCRTVMRFIQANPCCSGESHKTIHLGSPLVASLYHTPQAMDGLQSTYHLTPDNCHSRSPMDWASKSGPT